MLSQPNLVPLSSVLQASKLLQGMLLNLITHPHPQFSLAILEWILQDMMANTILQRSNILQSNRLLRRVPRGKISVLYVTVCTYLYFVFQQLEKSPILMKNSVADSLCFCLKVSEKSPNLTLLVKLLSMLLNLFRE